MADSNLAENLYPDLLRCGICLSRYKNPRGLPCLHCFCQECLEKHCCGRKEFPCPNCKQVISLPKDGVSGFPAHFLINNLLETLDKAPDTIKDTTCGNCRLCEATTYCQKCNKLFCQTCLTLHNIIRANKDHTYINAVDLQSGRLMLPPTGPEDQKCRNHEGELKKFYCETCDTLVCRDCIVLEHRLHQVLNLKEASEKHVAELNALSKGAEDRIQKCKAAITKTMEVKQRLSIAAKEVKQLLETVRSEYYKRVDSICEQHAMVAESVEVHKEQEIDRILGNLETTFAKLESARDLASTVTQTGSRHDIATAFPTLSTSLRELNELPTIAGASPSLGYVALKVPEQIDVPDLIQVLTVEPSTRRKWRGIKCISTKSVVEHPRAIAISKDGHIAIANGKRKTCCIMSKDDHVVKFALHIPSGVDLGSIAFTPDNNLTLPGKGEIVFFDGQGNKLTYPKVKTFTTYDVNGVPQEPDCLSVSRQGKIVARIGDGSRISVYDKEGTLISKFDAPGTPSWLAVTPKEYIAVSFKRDQLHVQKPKLDTVRLLDFSGDIVGVLHAPRGVIKWEPGPVCCSKQGELFVVNLGDPKAVYYFTEDGAQCLGCIITGLDDPSGIAISDDGQELYVTEVNQHVVSVFHKVHSMSTIKNSEGSIFRKWKKSLFKN